MLTKFKELIEAINDKIDNLDASIGQIINNYLNSYFDNIPSGAIIENIGTGIGGLVKEVAEDTFIIKLTDITAGDTAYIPTASYNTASFNWDVNWGDGGGWINYSGNSQSNDVNHVYNSTGEFVVKIRPHNKDDINWLAAFGNSSSGTTASTWFPLHLKAIYSPISSKMITVSSYSHEGMFAFCEKLEYVCDNFLPATTLASNCYARMFILCTSLIKFPKGLLPATTLAEKCYNQMFVGCPIDELKVGDLPATTLATRCYSYMFQNCTNITSLPTGLLPATPNQPYCYEGMFQNTGVIELNAGVFKPSALTAVEGVFYSMFNGCKNLTTVNGKFSNTVYIIDKQFMLMFNDCINLNHIDDTFFGSVSRFSGGMCCYRMFANCNGLTTIPNNFIKASVVTGSLGSDALGQMFKIDSGTPGLVDIGNMNAAWFSGAAASQTLMFGGQTNITTPITYANIPSGWK